MNNRQQAGSIGGHTSWARTANRPARTRPARQKSPASLDYWLARQPDELQARPMEERLLAAENAKQAHFKTLAMLSAAARRNKKAAA